MVKKEWEIPTIDIDDVERDALDIDDMSIIGA